MIVIRIALAVFVSPRLQPARSRPPRETDRPWCVQYGGNDGDNGTTCAFTSFEQTTMDPGAWRRRLLRAEPVVPGHGSGRKGPESTGQGNSAKRR